MQHLRTKSKRSSLHVRKKFVYYVIVLIYQLAACQPSEKQHQAETFQIPIVESLNYRDSARVQPFRATHQIKARLFLQVDFPFRTASCWIKAKAL